MKTIIRCVEQRLENAKLIKNKVENLNPELFVDLEMKGCGWSFYSCLKNATDDILILEDDIILSKNFEEKVKDIISKHKNDIICFSPLNDFNKDGKYGRTASMLLKEKKDCYLSNGFIYIMSVYIPKFICEKFNLWLCNSLKNKEFVKYFKKKQNWCDQVFTKFAKENKIKTYYVFNPAICGHNTWMKSTIGHGKFVQETLNFDYKNNF